MGRLMGHDYRAIKRGGVICKSGLREEERQEEVDEARDDQEAIIEASNGVSSGFSDLRSHFGDGNEYQTRM